MICLRTGQNLYTGQNLVDWTETSEMDWNGLEFRMRWNREVICIS